jgi:catechol 2,3-dioxygenase-like lactoylglutathione lyase family enzyme
MAAIRLDQLNLVVSNVPASRAFYARLGLDFGNAHDPVWDNHHISAPVEEAMPFSVDLDSVAFAPRWDAGWPGGSGVVLGFKVESREAVDTLVAELAKDGVPVQQPPFDAFWGARYAVVADPDGNAVGIMSPVDPALRSDVSPPP